MSGTIGVLGGMGPLATVDFMRKVIDLTPARRDQEHLPLIVYSVPQVPGRSACILEGAASPLPAMLRGIRTLAQAGAECIAIPCNTAHHWYDELARESRCPVLHIVDAACAAMERGGVGLLERRLEEAAPGLRLAHGRSTLSSAISSLRVSGAASSRAASTPSSSRSAAAS